MVGFEQAVGALKVIKDQIQYRSQSLLNLRPGETGQHCLPNIIVSVINQALPFCPWLMTQKQTTVFVKQC